MALGMALTAPAQVEMTFDATRRGPEISPHQYGLFFEEINHAGDGGLYAELVRNRSFEDNTTPEFWRTVNSGASISIVTDNLLNSAQQQALRLSVTGASESRLCGVANAGYWGMKFEKDSTYTLSLYVKGSNSGFTNHLVAQLQSQDGTQVLGEAAIPGTVETTGWTRLTASIKATGNAEKGRLALLTSNNGQLYLDVVSLFPYTWHGRPNGMRPDLAQRLADTKPTFLRFPGGCFVEGTGSYDNAFQWKKTLGPIENRPGHQNINWGYRSSDGLGFDEYLQFCEDLGADPMFVVNVGLGHGYTIPMEAVDTLVQNTLDAIEYANGDASTYWGARRIANGHAAPYGIKFIEIGNENYQANTNEQSQDYAERYYKFYKAIKEHYPDIITIGNVEAWGTDNPSWRNDYPVELVDEHYYRSHSWMLNNYKKYDSYPRSIGVYDGEYAANAAGTYGQYGTLNSALGEAVYMLGMERNSDVCRMASFAPIFMHENDPRWPYDMIHFSAAKHFCTPTYYVQKMMGNHLGKQNLLWTESGNQTSQSFKVGLGVWNTMASFDDVSLIDASGNILLGDDFSSDNGWTANNGTWTVADGVKKETATATNCTTIHQTAIGQTAYTYTLRARKDGGSEGFLVIFNYQDENNYAWWNVGGWNNGQHGIEVCKNGTKQTITTKAGSVALNRWYDLKVAVNGTNVKCYLDGALVHDVQLPTDQALYQSAQLDEDKGMMILKVVNPHATAQRLKLNFKNMSVGDATVVRLTAADGETENTMTAPEAVVPTGEMAAGDLANLDIPAYSLNIFTLKVADVAPEMPSETAAYDEEDANKYGYLFAHMNTTKEITNYALSKYGQTWTDLLSSGEVFDTKAVTATGGMRDAYVTRLHDGGFMLAGTDMTSSLGWSSNHIMDLMKSNDLVHWTKTAKIDLESPENLNALGLTAEEMTAAWAPQVIYDPVSGHYMLYYSVGAPDRHRIYYSMIDADLNVLTTPRLLFDPGYDVIDADIVWNELDKQYVMIYKYEGAFHLYRATATQLVPTTQTTGTCQWTIDPQFDIYEGGNGIEAPSLWRPIGSKKWKLGYMNYSGKGYRFYDLDEHCAHPSGPVGIQGEVQAQHGSYLKLTEAEYNYLKDWAEVKTLLPTARRYFDESQQPSIGDAVTKAEQALDESTTFEANAAAMSSARKALETCTDAYKAYLLQQAAEGNATTLTPFIINPDFAGQATGWTGTAFTNADGNVAEQWNKTFDFFQIIPNMPAGDYELDVQAFYRNGSKTLAPLRHGNGTEKLLALLYADTASASVMSLYGTDAYSTSPYTFPDNMATANAAFNTNGLYRNTLKFSFAGGDLRIGIRKSTTANDDWCCFDNFQLRYLGKTADGITAINDAEKARKGTLYDLQGRRLARRPAQGVYIENGEKHINK